jgi:hypothetical protein
MAKLLLLPVAAAWPATRAGIADDNIGRSLGALQGTPVDWAYDWMPNAEADAGSYSAAGVQYMPMVWGHPGLPDLDSMPDAEVMLGFNEPNMLEQSNMSPELAAELWPRVEAAARAHGVLTLVGPSLNWGDSDVGNPADWYRRFLAACPNCRVDAIGIHVYNCQLSNMKDRVDMFREFGKPLWVTEFACADNPSSCGKGWSCQCDYMREVIPYLHNEALVAGYAWFSKNSDYTGESSLVQNGQLTALGRCYASTVAAAISAALPSISV